MPASVRLLQKLKETWGDEVTQDLVSWVSEGQAVNRAELRELADLYFVRFGDRLEGRIAPVYERLARLDERVARVDERVTRLDERVAGLDARVAGLDVRVARLDERVGRLDERVGRVEERIAATEVRLEARIADLRAEFAGLMRDQMKWMFIFWAGTIVPLAGLMIALGKDWI